MTTAWRRAGGRARRRGYGLVELAMAILLVLVAMTLLVRGLALAGAERRVADRRLWAVEAASNVLERIAAEPFEGLTADAARALAAGAQADRVLPGAEWEVAVDADRGAPVPAKRVALKLRWKDRSGGFVAPVRLTAWVYRGRTRS